MTETHTLMTVAKEGVKQVGERFTKPTDDWEPVALCMDDKGQVHTATMDVPEGGHRATALGVLAWLKSKRAVEAVFISSAWMASAETEEEWNARNIRPSEDPDRVEAVIIVGAKGGETEAWSARIERHKRQPPTLGEWELTTPAGGDFYEALLEGTRV